MECALICESLEELSPKRFALSFDNVGLLVGRYDKDVKTIYIALDAADYRHQRRFYRQPFAPMLKSSP